MKKTLFFIILIHALKSFPIVPVTKGKDDIQLLESLTSQQQITYKNLSLSFQESLKKYLLDDPEQRLSPFFKINNYFLPSVRFWFKIYSEHSKDFIIIHDKNNLNIIYDAVNFQELTNSNLNRYTKVNLQTDIVRERLKNIRSSIKQLINNKNSPKIDNIIINALNRAELTLPKNQIKRNLFLESLLTNLRSQTGQKDVVIGAMRKYQLYQKTVEKLITLFQLPKEVISIPFVESSFNTGAESKASAVGAWQFVKRTGKKFMTIRKDYDQRINPIISTLSALHLLKQNFSVLKDWPLSITAYNSGTKNLFKIYKHFKNKENKLQFYFENHPHPNIAFASKNYYAEFLAMTYALNYSDMIFKDIEQSNYPDLKIYISLCNIWPAKLFKGLKTSDPNIFKTNTHFKNHKKKYPRGSILISTSDLNPKKFYKIESQYLTTYYPKNFFKLIKNHNCSNK